MKKEERSSHFPILRLRLRSAISLILVLQAVLICVCSLIIVYVFYGQYRDLLYLHASSVLETYVAACENRMEMVEKCSYNILSDRHLQKHFSTIDTALSDYDAYFAKEEAEKTLTNYLFTQNFADSICYITNDGIQLFGQYLSPKYDYSEETIADWRKIADEQKGRSVWSYDVEAGRLYLLRSIRGVTSGDFSNLGMLVIACPIQNIFTSDLDWNATYSPVLQITEGETRLFTNFSGETEELSFLDNVTEYGNNFFDTESGRYYCTTKISTVTGWTYSCFISELQMLKEINALTSRIVIIIIIVLIMTLLLSAILSGSILNRFGCLIKRMDQIRKGKYGEAGAPPSKKRYEIEEIAELDRHFTSMADEIDYLINDVYTHELSLRDARYRILQNQINPHFLYNTLETINNIARCQGQREISLMVQALSKMMRNALTDDDLISLREELQILESYISIQKIRFEERLAFSLDVPEKFRDVSVPKLTLQPLVENSINYGLEQLSKVCVLCITARQQGQNIQILIQDNGPGMTPEYIQEIFSGKVVPRHTGLGVKNVDERLKYMFGPQSGLSFESIPGQGCTAIITVPYQDKEEL